MSRRYYLILSVIILSVLSILAFDVYILKFGKFWERKPHPVTPVMTIPTPSPTQSAFLSNPLVAKAKEIGYNIIWMDAKDTVGRTVFYDWRGSYGNGGIVAKEVKNPDGTTYIRHVTGLFQEFQDIPGSKDKYLLLKYPQNNSFLPLIRIIFESQAVSTASGAFPFPQTSLLIENLDIMASDETRVYLKYLNQWQPNNLEKILRKNDMVAAFLFFNAISTGQNGNNIQAKNVYDKENRLAVLHLYLRRFGGKSQIENELGRPISK